MCVYEMCIYSFRQFSFCTIPVCTDFSNRSLVNTSPQTAWLKFQLLQFINWRINPPKMKVQKTKSNNSGREIEIEHKWSIEEVADHGNADTITIQGTVGMQPEVLVQANWPTLMMEWLWRKGWQYPRESDACNRLPIKGNLGDISQHWKRKG